jgi:peptide deformylase
VVVLSTIDDRCSRLVPVEVITVDNPRAAVLRRRAKPVGKVTPEIQQVVSVMLDTMHEYNGVGLAAPQVGISKRIFVAEVEDKVHVLIDPQIIRRTGEETATEACLSIPGVAADVPRAAAVTVKAKSRRGRGITVSASGLLARVFQHEIDHLDGILFLDRVVDKSTIRDVAESAEVEAAPPR